MFNLIDQSNILKGLDDQSLQREAQQPSGAVPPYLVLSEISRRKDMRQRYGGELAQQAPKTTVMQDVLAAPAMPGMGAQPSAMPPAGLAAAGAPPGGPGFAGGGLVDAADPSGYEALKARYQSDLNSLPGDRDREAALALIATGAGIAGGGHSNFGQNLAVGVDNGINAYEKGLQTTDTRETNALRGLSDIAGAQHADELARLQMAQNAIPASAREFEYYKGLPKDQQDEFIDVTNPALSMKRDMLTAQVLTPETLDQIATQYLAGDKSVVTGFGRSPTARSQIANAIATKAAALGLDGNAIAAQMSAYMGNVAGQKAAGTRAAQVGIASDEANKMADLALTSSKAVPRGEFVPFNKIANAVATNTSSPQMAAFYSATMSLVNAYARAISPVGAPTDAMRQKAIDMLNTAQGPEAYAATIAQMKKEMEAALSAPADVSNRLKAIVAGPAAVAPDATVAVDPETQSILDKYPVP